MADQKDPRNIRNRSKKAMEYKVYWLERKLAFERANEKRNRNAAKIEGMTPSPVKELLHLNNEFHRANEQATDLKHLTEEVNGESLKINERSEQLQEQTLNSLADSERSHRQSRRLQERSRKSNAEAARLSAATRKLNKKTSQLHQQTGAQNGETEYLNKLSRAQHKATDSLNNKTRQLNVDGEAAKNASKRQTESSVKVQALGENLNKRSMVLQSQLMKTKDDFTELNQASDSIKEEAKKRFNQLNKLNEECNEVIVSIQDVEEKAIDVINEGEQFLSRASDNEESAERNFEQYRQMSKDGLDLLNKLDRDGNRTINETHTASDCLLQRASQQFQTLENQTNKYLVTLTNQTESSLSDIALNTNEGVTALVSHTSGRLEQLETNTNFQLSALLKGTSREWVAAKEAFEGESSSLLTALQDEAETILGNTLSELDSKSVSFYAKFDRKLKDQLESTESQHSKSVTEFNETSSNFLAAFDKKLNHNLLESERRINSSIEELEENTSIFLADLDQKLDTQLLESETLISNSVSALGATSSDFLAAFDKKLTERLQASVLQDQSLASETRSRNLELHETLQQQAVQTIGNFNKTSNDLITKSESTLDKLSERAVTLVNESQDFLTHTENLNTKTESIIEEGESLNDHSQNLQRLSQQGIEEADALISELAILKGKLRAEVDEMLANSTALNQQTTDLNQQGETINHHSLAVQQESMRTQELSQEINSHSLELQEEARRVNTSFLEINQDHHSLSATLTTLKSELEQLARRGDDQFHHLNESNDAGERINKVSAELNTETRALNQQTIALMEEAKASLSKTQGLNKLSRQVADEIQMTRSELEQLRDDVIVTKQESTSATDAARLLVSEGRDLHEQLTSATDQFKQTQQNASAELKHIQQMRAETSITTEESKEACSTLKQCIDDSRRINDEFLRGLEAATATHQQTEVEVNTLLNETSSLQQEITDILELKDGIGNFQSNVNQCQQRLDEYSNLLSSCQQTTFDNTEVITDYQNRLENYQSDTERFRKSLEQCEARARRVESHIREYEERLIGVENQPASNFQKEIADQLEHIRSIEARIRQEISVKQALVDETLRAIKQNIQSEVTQVADRMLVDVRAEFAESQRASTDRHDSESQRVAGSLQAHKILLDNHDVKLNTHALNIQEHDYGLNSLSSQMDEVNHRLQNYQRLLQSEIDKPEDHQLSDRLALIEAKIENQDAMLKDKLPRLEKRESESNTDTLQMTEMLERFKHSMDDAVTTNQTLKVSLDETQKVNNQLAKMNARLQRQLEEAKTEQTDYLQKLDLLEDKIAERPPIEPEPLKDEIEQLKLREDDTLQTMQQMRLTMKESTRAMRETQKALEHFRHKDNVNPAVQAPQSTPVKRAESWASSSKQAVVSSLFAVAIVGMGIFGIDAVDASNNTPADAVISDLSRMKTLPTNHGLDPLDLDEIINGPDKEFQWPLNAGVADPSSVKYQEHRDGVSISAELGSPVLAVNDGEVIYSANEIRGYGNVIVIQHKDELVSVYANNQFNYVRKGDQVERGQLIGDVGQLFNEDQAGLYFEIRYDGKPEDPFSYLGYETKGYETKGYQTASFESES